MHTYRLPDEKTISDTPLIGEFKSPTSHHFEAPKSITGKRIRVEVVAWRTRMQAFKLCKKKVEEGLNKLTEEQKEKVLKDCLSYRG